MNGYIRKHLHLLREKLTKSLFMTGGCALNIFCMDTTTATYYSTIRRGKDAINGSGYDTSRSIKYACMNKPGNDSIVMKLPRPSVGRNTTSLYVGGRKLSATCE